MELAADPVEERQQSGAVAGAVAGVNGLDLRMHGESATHDRAPEPLNLRQVS